MTTTIFDDLRRFHQRILTDETFAAQLPTTLFDLRFTPEGDVVINQQPMGVNVRKE